MKTRICILLLAATVGLSSCQSSRQAPAPPGPGPTSGGTGAPPAPNPNPAPPNPPPPTPLALKIPPPAPSPGATGTSPPLAAAIPDQPAIALNVPASPPARPYRAILKLKQEGLSDEFILKKVRTDNVNYQLTTPEILELRAAGISETILEAMLRSGQPANR